jgi:glycine cleavage system regulatory protein
MRHEKASIYDHTYNSTHPPFSLRLDPKVKDQIPDPKTPWILDAIQMRLESRSTESIPSRSTHTKLLHFLIRTFIDANLEIDIPEDLYGELLEVMKKEMHING